MRSLLALVKKNKILISDGAWGTQLHQLGLKGGECPELWNITHRKEVLTVAKGYVDAGADMILTNSFGASPAKLSHWNLNDRAFEINEAAANISREAAGDECLVLGSIGPTGVILMMGKASKEDLYNSFSIQAEALAKGGADAICVETMADIEEATLAIKAAKEKTDCEIICTFTFEKISSGAYKTMMGVSPEGMVSAVKDAGADIIGTNCGNGIEGMIDIVRAIRKIDKETPVLVHANAGKPVFRNGVTTFPETPDVMAGKAPALIEAGANIIGGCCGTTPDHIRAMIAAVKK
ncbi:MAG: homocysteine S-methyltransferase family protein [Spirochaetes bacterium]|nr:homocysteine S-methyltransferase family protein [Spirochaetota bacterium]